MEETRLGRPRSEAAHQAILAATRDLLIEHGYAALSMDRVATRAGVGKQTVYRRWPSKAPLVAEAVLENARSAGNTRPPDTGDLHQDLRSWLRKHIAFLTEGPNAALIRALAAAAADDPHDAEALYQQLTGPARDDLLHRLRSGVDTGQVRAEADLEAAADAVIGAVLYQAFTSDVMPVPARRVDGLLDIIMSGLRTDRPPAPGR